MESILDLLQVCLVDVLHDGPVDVGYRPGRKLFVESAPEDPRDFWIRPEVRGLNEAWQNFETACFSFTSKELQDLLS